LRLSADQGNASAQYSLGICYYYGKGVYKNVAEVIRYWRMSADQGNVDAQYSLGNSYYHEARRYYQLAAKGGHSEAQKQLSELRISDGVFESNDDDNGGSDVSDGSDDSNGCDDSYECDEMYYYFE
jgi:hypothetical protein